MLCIYCNKEFDSKRATAKYCSPSCRVKHSRVSVTENLSVTPLSVTKELSVTEKEEISVTSAVSVTSLSKDELYSAIHSYKEDLWYDSPEYKELILRLNSMSVSKLQEKGYHIPNWKLKNG